MSLLPGNYGLAGPSTSAAARQPSNGPPKAIFLKLSDAAYQQLKVAGSNGIPKLAVELASGSNVPTALNIGDSSYTITKRTASVVTSDQSLNEVLVASSSSLVKGKGRAINDTASSSGLVSLAPPCRETFSIAPGPPRKAVVQKTAENMAERIRERNAQLEREKVGRRVVVVDDESLLANGKKGKGKKLPGKGPASASSLLRTSAIAAKRSPSPAGVSPRNSPVIGATTRAPSRLIANEAAKGLISRKEKEKQRETDTAQAPSDPTTVQPQPTQTAIAVVQAGKDPSGIKVSEKVRLASSSSSTSSHSSTSSSLSSNPSTSTSISSAPSLPTIKTSPLLPSNEEPGPARSATKSQQQSVPAQPKPPPQKYHHPRQDDSDLASASSSSEDESATMPLARRLPSPVKTTAPPLPAPVPAKTVRPAAPTSTKPVSQAKALPAKAASPPQPTKASVAAVKKPSPSQKPQPSEPSLGKAPTLPIQAARPITAASAKSQALLDTASASTSRSSSADRASSSSSSSDERAIAVADKSAQLARKRKLEQQEAPSSKTAVNSSPQVTVSAPEAKKPRRSSGSNGTGGPKTAAKTAGGSRLSKALPKRSPVQSGRTSPQPPAPTAAVPPAPTSVPIVTAPSSEKKPNSSEKLSAAPKTVATVTPPKPQASHTSRSASPIPRLTATKATTANLSPLVVGTPPASRAGSPLPSPTAHPLPPKPAASSVSSARPSPAHTASSRSPNPQARDIAKVQPVAGSAPPSPGPTHRSLPKTLPASLPARPSTIIPPTGPSDRRDSRDTRPIGATEARHASRQGNGASSTLPSGTNSGASSPIVSHFPKKSDNGRLSAPSSAANTPKLGASSSFDKMTKSPATKLDSSATKKRESEDRSVSSDRSAKKHSKASHNRMPSQSKSEKEEGEAEDEEGEVDAEGESDEDDKKHEESHRGRSTEKKAVASSAVDAAKSTSKPRRVTDSSSLPSFKKGRAAELLAAEAKAASGRKSSPVSRADTPISHSPAREESPLPLHRANDAKVRISSDEEFRDVSRKFTEELFPSYSKLYKRLEEVQNGLSNGRKGLKLTTEELLKQVEDVNQRGQELQSIRDALGRYNDEKQRRAIKT